MIDWEYVVLIQVNNVLGNLNLFYVLKEDFFDCYLVKLGIMGEYGMFNIDIEEGYIIIEYKGCKDILFYFK